jgi:hypothetical protein
MAGIRVSGGCAVMPVRFHVGGYTGSVHIIGFLAGIVLFVGGIVLMGYSFEPLGFMLPFGFDPRIVLFIAGVFISSAGLAVPFHVMKRIDG